MIEEPPIPAPDEQDQGPRYRWAWAVLWIIFGLLLVRAVLGSYEQPKKADEYPEAALVLRQTVNLNRFVDRMKSALPDKTSREQIESATSGTDSTISDLVDKAKTDPLAAKYYAALRTEQHKTVFKEYLAVLESSKSPADRAFAQVYAANKLTPAQAAALAKQIPTTPFVNAVARAHAFEKAGDKSELARIAPLRPFVMMMVLFVVGTFAFFGGCGLAVSYIAMRRSGKLPPKGHPFEPLTLGGADALALRASQLIVGFLVIGTISAPVLQSLPKGLPSVVIVAVMIAFVVLLFRLDVFGQKFTLARLGLTTKGLGVNVLWGLGGYLANLPFILFAALIVSTFTQYFPAAHHPAIDVLTNHPTPAVLFGLWLQACVLAPFWEEIMFRGCLFPALTKVTRSPVWGAVISSLMFAAIHPQGVIGWLPIATIAGMNCLLVYQTRSLIPCMILHSVNNTVTLALSLLILAK